MPFGPDTFSSCMIFVSDLVRQPYPVLDAEKDVEPGLSGLLGEPIDVQEHVRIERECRGLPKVSKLLFGGLVIAGEKVTHVAAACLNDENRTDGI